MYGSSSGTRSSSSGAAWRCAVVARFWSMSAYTRCTCPAVKPSTCATSAGATA
ncbi:MAG: hypothetical protein AB1730_13015 [Myxococcota bacterium]